MPEHAYNGSDDGTLLLRAVQDAGGRAGYFMVGAQLPGMAGDKAPVDFDERAMTVLYDAYAHIATALLGQWR